MTPREIRRMAIGAALIIVGLIGFTTCSKMDDNASSAPATPDRAVVTAPSSR